MFVIPRPNVIQSTEGFSVEVLGMTGLLYTEGPRHLEINSEVMGLKSGVIIYENTIKSWLPPFDKETIDETKRALIIENIRRAFRFREFEIEVL